jgi:RNA polymerase sigma-70 factor (ECF subfamily)
MDDASGNEDVERFDQWRSGDPAAFAALVRRWQQPVARFLAAMVGRDDLVADLCQEVFLHVFLARSRYRETGAFSSWLYRIAMNVARDACRRKRSQPQLLPDHELHGLAPFNREATPGRLTTPEQQELAQAIALGLAELPLPLSQVLVLRHYEGIQLKEMARMLGVAPSTLRSRFEVGMSRLRAFLKQRGWALEENQR